MPNPNVQNVVVVVDDWFDSILLRDRGNPAENHDKKRKNLTNAHRRVRKISSKNLCNVLSLDTRHFLISKRRCFASFSLQLPHRIKSNQEIKSNHHVVCICFIISWSFWCWMVKQRQKGRWESQVLVSAMSVQRKTAKTLTDSTRRSNSSSSSSSSSGTNNYFSTTLNFTFVSWHETIGRDDTCFRLGLCAAFIAINVDVEAGKRILKGLL